MPRALLPLLLAIVGCTTREAPVVTTRPPTDDPRAAVTSWSLVERFHCARGAGGAVARCSGDGDCAGGRVCDTSVGCGCCVPPPPRIDPGATLRRYLFTACTEGRCAPPPYCAPSADGVTCTMRFDREIPLWLSTWAAPAGEGALAETRRALCVLVEPHQDCMWTLEIPGGAYTADSPVPTRYEGSYECGGRTCNGVEAVRASPRVGSSYTVRLTAQRCGG